MLVSRHVIISFLIALVLYPFFGLYSILFFLSGFLIDVDHYIEYAIANKDINLFNCLRFFNKSSHKNIKLLKDGKAEEEDKTYFHIFHSFEFIILLGVFSFFSKILFFVFLGVLSHVLLDLVNLAYLKAKFRGKIQRSRNYSAIIFWLERPCADE